MRIIFWGTPEYAVPILEKLFKSKHHVVGIVTQPDKRRGRGKQLVYSPVKQKGLAYKIPILTPRKLKGNQQFNTEIENLGGNIYIVVAYGKILPEEVLEQPQYGSWNIHASLLPNWRGAAPIQWSIINGDKLTGVTIMNMEVGLDTGPILIEEELAISTQENAISLSNRLSNLSADLILKALEIIETKKTKEEQDIKKRYSLTEQEKTNRIVSYARMINKSDYLIDWTKDSIEIHRKIMGLYPGCYSYWNTKRIKILASKVMSNIEYELKNELIAFSNDMNLKAPGEIIYSNKSFGLIVKTKDSALLIFRAQLEGKKVSDKEQLTQQIRLDICNRFSNTKD